MMSHSTLESAKKIGEILDHMSSAIELNMLTSLHEPRFENLFRIDVRILKLSGLSSMKTVFHEDTQKSSRWEAIPVFIEVACVVFFVFCELRTIKSVILIDPDYAIAVLAAGISGLLCAFKGLRIWLYRCEIYNLIRQFAIMWKDSRTRVAMRNETFNMAKRSSTVSYLYALAVSSVIMSYVGLPYFLLLQHELLQKNETFDFSQTVYPTSYPFSTDTIWKYLLCSAWEGCVLIIAGFYWVSCDSLFAQLTTHTSIHLKVLCHDLRSLKKMPKNSYGETRKNKLEKLSEIVNRHHNLYMSYETIRIFFNPIIFLTLVINGAHLCLCMYRLDRDISAGKWDGVMKNLFHLVTLAIQTIIYCGFADNLTNLSGQVAEAAYHCEWTEFDRDAKSILIFIIMRAQKTYKCTAYGIIEVNLNQITKIIRTAVSYFTLLKTISPAES